MTNAAILFVSSYAVVFLLGLQSLTVNGGYVRAAALNSCLIGIANITLLKLGSTATGWEVVAYVGGGPLGIVSSIYFFRWYRKQKT